MSRILRRPMFRGGRVDSRGTGITSNLGYKKGGSVNTPRRGLVNQPGGYAGDGWSFLGGHVDQDKLNKIMGPGGTLIGDANRGLTGINDLLYNWIARPAGNLPYWLSDYVLGTDLGMPIQKKDSFKEWVGMAPQEPIITDSGAIPKAIKQQDDAILLEKLEAEKAAAGDKSLEEIMKEMMGSKKTKKETIEEYKEIFKDAYGSGVADDASTMALSLAGKMLKPEATVKSGFGEFFEGESKRPSSRQKYKDAATTAAINAFLTGEKDYDSMMKQMKIIDYQIGAKSDAAKAAKKDLSFIEIKSGLPTSISKDRERTKAAAELFIQYTDKGKTLTVIDEDEDTDELLKAAENEGQYFMNNETKEVFKILKGIKQFIYGG